MSKVLIFIEGNDQELKNSSKELLSCAKSSGCSIEAFALGTNAEPLAKASGSFGATPPPPPPPPA